MLEAILNLNEENKEGFIKKYGYINDPDLAKELLCITSETWKVLDNSLKNNSEIIMYYQPMGYYDFIVYEDFGGISEPLCGDGTQVGFEFDDRGLYQIPKINFPKDFDFEMYIAIQRELTKNKKEFESIYEAGLPTRNIKFNDDCDYIYDEYTDNHYYDDFDDFCGGPSISEKYFIYDRTMLKEIIDNILYNNNSKTYVKHK